MTFNLTDKQIAQAWDETRPKNDAWTSWAEFESVDLADARRIQIFAQCVAALVAEQQPATVVPEVDAAMELAASRAWDDGPWATAQVIRDQIARRMRPATLADVLPDFPNLGEGTWEYGPARIGEPLLSLERAGVADCGSVWRFVPADPDVDVKKELVQVMHKAAKARPGDDLRVFAEEALDIVRKADQ